MATKQVLINHVLYAVYDPATETFLSKRRTTTSNWSWTKDPSWIHLFKTERLALKNSTPLHDVVEFSVMMVGNVVVNVKEASQKEFDGYVDRFVYLQLKERLSISEDREYGVLKRKMIRLDRNRLNQLISQTRV